MRYLPRINVPFIVQGQSIKQHPRIKIAAGGHNYFYAVFDICSTWDKLDGIKASFQSDNMDKPIIINLVKGADNCVECKIPWEVMAKVGYFDTGIFGGDRLLTSTTRTFVTQGCMCDGNNPEPPSPDWFANIENEVKEFENEIRNEVKEFEGSIVSPTISVMPIDDGHRVVVEDVNHAQMFDVKNGTSPHIGKNGNWYIGNTDTGIKAQGYTPQRGVDYYTDADKAEMVDAVLDALPDGDVVSY